MSSATMAAVVQYGLEREQVELREVPVPAIGDEDVLLRVAGVGVCGSDIHQYHATQSWPVRVPVTLGHEFAGVVALAGRRVAGFREGDRVVSETAAVICGQCLYCRAGHYNVCPERRGFGYGIDGAMAEYVRVPARCLHHIPESLPFELAAITEPTCVAYHAVAERSEIRPGQSVLILGPGPIGLLCLLVARLCGAGAVLVAGLTADAARLSLARELGATSAIDLQTEDLLEIVRELGDGYGVDVVIDAAGVAASFRTALEVVRPLGQITKVGWGPGPLGCSLDPLVQKEVRVNGSFSHTYRTWEQVIALLASRQIDPRPLVGLLAPLERWHEGFEGMHAGQFAKAVLQP